MRRALILLLALPLLAKSQTVYLIGDAGEPSKGKPALKLLTEKTQNANKNDVLLFLGDNLYPKGLPNKEHPERAAMEAKLNPQLDLMKSFKGKSYMIPGNHDWAQGRNYGWEQALNMEAYIREYLGRDDAFLPAGGCPGPLEIELSPSIVMIVINTQYLLHPWDKPDEDDLCENKSTIEALAEISTVIQRNKGRHILIAAHHPVYTYGEHNGNFPIKDHIFPFTALNKNLYIPLPVIGSIHPLFRKGIGNIQDNTHPKYKAIMRAIISAMDETEDVVFASGHEHSLQFIQQGKHHYIVSGSGAKTTHLKKGKSAFGKSELGFSEVNYDEGKASVKFWGASSGLLYEQDMYDKDLELEGPEQEAISFQDSTVTVVASERYQAGKGKQKWLGGNYRDVWNTPVEVKVFDLATERGGLKVLKKGGGMQTKSLRLEAENGRQYVLRSIEKYPENAMPPALRKTFAQGIVQDQISSSHPYGAFVVPKLADAVGVYHTNPVPVWIPDDPRLGQFQQTFAGTLAVYEERPNKEAASEPFFGGGRSVRGTFDVIERLRKDNDNSVDQQFVVRNRLFDMWMGDWDRHDDQWRWAEFEKEGKGRLYRPIPRDRDQVFFINEGIIPKIASRKWAIPKIEGFDEEVRWAPGISQNARFFDRSFMNEPDWEVWEEQIKFLQERLTDDVIEEALSGWPQEIQDLTKERVTKGLKARRADLNRFARELYLFISKEVEVVGSDKHEYFLIERKNEHETLVTVRKRKKDGTIEGIMYQRLFKSNETKEVRLFGLDGEDVFEFMGDFNSKTRIRVIGGTDKDVIKNSGQKLQKVLVYDRKKSTQFEGNSKGISRLSTKPEINNYDRKSFKYDILMPLALVQFTPDDGVFVGGGFTYTKNKWRKEPFASKHTVLGTFSASTNSFNFKYNGTFTDVVGKWSLNPTVVWQQPFFVNNFFGVGNETKFLDNQFTAPDDKDIDYYRVKMNRLEADLDMATALGSKGRFYVGGGYRSIEVRNTANRFISSTEAGLDPEDFDRNNFGKLRTGISVDTRANKIMPTGGVTARADIEYFSAITDFSKGFTRVSGEWAFYLSAKLPARLVIGNRVGAAHNIGDTEFFNANTLGGLSNLRGYRRTRFYGETSFYHNFDLRLKLFSFRSYIFPGQFGILGFHDVGRVWVDGENSNNWHTGKGGGIWISPLNSAVIALNYGIGEDENLVVVNLGFFF